MNIIRALINLYQDWQHEQNKKKLEKVHEKLTLVKYADQVLDEKIKLYKAQEEEAVAQLAYFEAKNP